MTKNSAVKKAARRYQQEHPGTTFPEAMRAVARAATPRSVSEVVSEDEMRELLERLAGRARERGAFIGLDESARLHSERQWAVHIRAAAIEVGMNELAERLDPQQFAPGLFERVMAQGRAASFAPSRSASASTVEVLSQSRPAFVVEDEWVEVDPGSRNRLPFQGCPPSLREALRSALDGFPDNRT